MASNSYDSFSHVNQTMFLTFSLFLFKILALISSINSVECSPEELEHLCEIGSFSRDLISEKILRSLNVLLGNLHKAPLMYGCMHT